MTETGGNPQPSEEPLPGYDTMPAAEVVQRLSNLSAEQRDAVAAYERIHLARRPVLARAAELSGRGLVDRARKDQV
jgi:hypothetical protein